MYVVELGRSLRELGAVGGMRRVVRGLRKRKRGRGSTEGVADDRGGVGSGMKGDVAYLWQLGLGNLECVA